MLEDEIASSRNPTRRLRMQRKMSSSTRQDSNLGRGAPGTGPTKAALRCDRQVYHWPAEKRGGRMNNWWSRIQAFGWWLIGPAAALKGGREYLADGNAPDALRWSLASEAMYRKRYGPTHPGVASAMALRASCSAALGNSREALRLYRAAINIEVACGPRARPKELEKWQRLAQQFEARQRSAPGEVVETDT